MEHSVQTTSKRVVCTRRYGVVGWLQNPIIVSKGRLVNLMDLMKENECEPRVDRGGRGPICIGHRALGSFMERAIVLARS